MPSHNLSRRSALAAMAAAPTGLALGATGAEAQEQPAPLKGNVNHSVCRWCFKDWTLDELCLHAKSLGLGAIDLLEPDEWPTARKHGLTCSMAKGPGPIQDGWNEPDRHDDLVRKAEERIRLVADAGLKNVIVFSGNRRNLSDAEGIKHCAKGLKRIMPLAEQLGVTVCMELLNSKRTHPDYQCDKTPFGAAVVDEVGSDHFRLLYDIYHMQIMEGDVIQTILDYKDYIAHYHTGGVPGRAEIDETQELNYTRICQVIVETGYTGYIAQEFIPRRDPLASLRQGVAICDV